MKKILYAISYNTGGHVSAAKAMIAAMEGLKLGPFDHKLIDLFSKTSGFWNFFQNSYSVTNEYFPWFYNMVYHYFNDPKRYLKTIELDFPSVRKRIAKVIKEEKPDLILSMFGPTNHLITRALEYLGIKTPVVTYVLDPINVNFAWVNPDVDCQLVATQEARDTCIKFGMPEEKIKIMGFPVHPGFLQDYGRKEDLRKRFGLDPQLFTLFLIGGGSGIGRILNIAQALNSSDLKIQLIVVAGFNKRLETKFCRTHFRFPTKIFGFTDRIPEIMSASDAMITKAGPGAIFEAIAKELPLIITGHISGQEKGNVDYAKKNGIGIIAREPGKIVEAVREIQAEGTKKFKSNLRRLKNPAAIYEIALLVASYLG